MWSKIVGVFEKNDLSLLTILIKNYAPFTPNLRPDLSGALFMIRRRRSTKKRERKAEMCAQINNRQLFHTVKSAPKLLIQNIFPKTPELAGGEIV